MFLIAGWPSQAVTDFGPEAGGVRLSQVFLRRRHTDRLSFYRSICETLSTRQTPIERRWLDVRVRAFCLNLSIFS